MDSMPWLWGADANGQAWQAHLCGKAVDGERQASWVKKATEVIDRPDYYPIDMVRLARALLETTEELNKARELISRARPHIMAAWGALGADSDWLFKLDEASPHENADAPE